MPKGELMCTLYVLGFFASIVAGGWVGSKAGPVLEQRVSHWFRKAAITS
jgi:hypothetical protein